MTAPDTEMRRARIERALAALTRSAGTLLRATGGGALPDDILGIGGGKDAPGSEDAFDDRMVRLLETLAGRLGHAVDTLRVKGGHAMDGNQIQAQLIQTAKLATLGEMAAGLVHELSQPLNIIRLTAEGALLSIERGKATADWQTVQFSVIADQAQRTAEIIDSIRLFSRRDTGPVAAFDALHAFRTAVAVLERQMQADGIALEVDFPLRPFPVRGRRVHLEQVAMNLLSNAHHALREKRERGAPPDWRPLVSLVARYTDGRLRLDVADNGPGIPAQMRDHIFEPFFTTKEAGIGTGLGLSVSFDIIAAMGGSLECRDQPEGTCFTITLPIDDQSALPAAPAIALPPAPAIAGAHVMVVDDEAAAAQAMAGFLAELGYRTSVCVSGEAAYARFLEDPADVVVTDLLMPAGTGEQLVERLREYDPLLPIVVVTGHLGASEALDSLQDDRYAVLKKPVALHRLGEIVADFTRPPA